MDANDLRENKNKIMKGKKRINPNIVYYSLCKTLNRDSNIDKTKMLKIMEFNILLRNIITYFLSPVPEKKCVHE